jgi:hypothetical protein
MNIINKKYHIAFWLLIGFSSSSLLYLYLRQVDRHFLPSIIPALCTIIQLLVTERLHSTEYYYPTKVGSFIIINSLFFMLFLFMLFYLSSIFLLIKLGAFLIMSMVGLYTSYFLWRHYYQQKSKTTA